MLFSLITQVQRQLIFRTTTQMLPSSLIDRLLITLPWRCLFTCLLTFLALPLHGQERPYEIYLENDQQAAALPQRLTAFLSWLQQQSIENQLPGAAVALVSGNRLIDIRTWGVRSSDKRQPLDENSLFRIASVSKTFAGTVASLAIANQPGAWDLPLADTLPQLQLGTGSVSRTITLKNIVSHTTGLMPHAYSNMLDAGVAYDDILKKFPEIPTVCPPGRCYGYQNVVFSLIADFVEVATLTSYEEYLQRELFEPLGMTSASTGLDNFLGNQQATAPHRRVRGNWRTTTHNPAYYTVTPAAGINASITDMAIWARANLGGFPEVLPPSLLERQHNPVIETPRGNYFNRWQGLEKAYYALGWRVLDYRGVRVVHHGGGVRGYRSEVALVPEFDLGLVVLFNAETRLANDIVPAFLDNLLQ